MPAWFPVDEDLTVAASGVAQYVEGVDAFGLDTDRRGWSGCSFQPVLVVWALWGGGWLARGRTDH